MNRELLVETLLKPEVALPLFAAIFAYLSWRRISMGGTYEREELVRNRFSDSANVTSYYRYQLGTVQITELGGWGYKLWKYIPLIGGIKGQAIVYLYFSSPDGNHPPTLPPVDSIRSHPKYDELPIAEITWKDPVDLMYEGDEQLEIIFDTINPDKIHKGIYDLSGIMMELNQQEEVVISE